MDWQLISLILGCIVSASLIFRYLILKPLITMITRFTEPLQQSLKELKESINNLSLTSKEQFSSISKQQKITDERLELAEKQLAVHDTKIDNIQDQINH